jgi:hypothetical protein
MSAQEDSPHTSVAKLIASAQLNPMLKPAWYAAAFRTMNSPAAKQESKMM